MTGVGKALAFHAAFSTESDPTIRPLPFRSLQLPWAPARQAPPPLPEGETDLAGGDYERGRTLFFGERIKCGACHRLRGEGATCRPALRNPGHRDRGSLVPHIKAPRST